MRFAEIQAFLLAVSGHVTMCVLLKAGTYQCLHLFMRSAMSCLVVPCLWYIRVQIGLNNVNNPSIETKTHFDCFDNNREKQSIKSSM